MFGATFYADPTKIAKLDRMRRDATPSPRSGAIHAPQPAPRRDFATMGSGNTDPTRQTPHAPSTVHEPRRAKPFLRQYRRVDLYRSGLRAEDSQSRRA